MSDPVRLLDGEDALAVRVLASAREDAAPRHVHRRVSVALGLGAIAGASATTTAAAATTTAKGAALLASIGVAKIATVVVVAGIAAAGAAAYVPQRPAAIGEAHHAAHDVSAPSQSTATRPRPAPGIAEPPATIAAPGATAQPVPSPTPTAVSLPTPAPTAVTTTVLAGLTPPADKTGLLQELIPLDAAHAAFDAGDDALAMRHLDRHDLDYPHGQLAPEALALRVEIYARRHDDTKVDELGRRFLARYPEHPQTARVQAILDRVAKANNP